MVAKNFQNLDLLKFLSNFKKVLFLANLHHFIEHYKVRKGEEPI